MGELIQCGEQGMEGVIRFSKYFVEKHGVSVDESSRTFYVQLKPLRKILSSISTIFFTDL
jgi:hypothetical protein